MKRTFAIIFLVLITAFSPSMVTVHADGSQKICAKDMNGDGNVDFTSEVASCMTVQGSDFCPLGAVNCGLGTMDPLCPTNGTGCPGGTYNPTLNRCERPQIVTGYKCPTTGTTYGNQTSCQSACMQTASCQTGTYSVSVSPDQSSSYWFYNGAYRMFCSGSGLYLSANPGGSNRSWTLSGASCSGDANGGENAFITYLQGSGNQLYVYGCDGMQDPEYGSWMPVNCGRLFGVLTFDRAVVSGSTRGMSCILDDASYLSFHDRCDWATWTSIGISGALYQSCPLGNYPCSGGTCSTGSACNAVNGCPAGYQLVNDICIAQPQGGAAVTVNGTTHMCETPVTNSCTGVGFSYDSACDACIKNADCGEGVLEGGLDLCTFKLGSDRCPAGFEYNAAFSACTRDAVCPGGGILDRLRDVCEATNVPSCPEGTVMDQVSGKCLATPFCQVGSYDAGLDNCSVPGSSLCPAEYTFNSFESRCERSPSCGDGSAYSAALDLCLKEPVRLCPTSDYAYQASSRECVAQPVCYVGNFDPVTNRCSGSITGCPLGSQYACLPNPATGILQCSDNVCFNQSAVPTQTTGADTSSYQNDGTVDPSTGDCQGTIYIFNGRGRECRTAGISTTFFNCCDTDPGSFLFIQNTCGSGDAETVQAAGKGMCHYIGDYCQQKWPLIGCVQRANTYCCFNSKLGRIIHEQGRAQLRQFGAGGDWGGAENPNCRGLTPEEFQMLDFSRIDLSEYFGDIKTKAASEVQQDMQRQVSDFYDKVQGK